MEKVTFQALEKMIQSGIKPYLKVISKNFEEFEGYDEGFIVQLVNITDNIRHDMKELTFDIPNDYLEYNKEICKKHKYIDGSYKTYFDVVKNSYIMPWYYDSDEGYDDLSDNLAFLSNDSYLLHQEYLNSGKNMNYVEYLEALIMLSRNKDDIFKFDKNLGGLFNS